MRGGGFTPGPWQFLNGCDIFSALGADSGDGCPAAPNDGWHVAAIPDTTTTVDGLGNVELGRAVKSANGRLIAAAPDLLEALKDALEYLQHHLPEEALAPHRAAIAKATQP